MDTLTDLRELLKHELKDLYSAEIQIIEAMPKMIENARNPQLKKALSDHLKVTHGQKDRLDKIEELLNYRNDKKEEDAGFFANLFRSNEGEQHCKAMEGLIKEAESLMKEDMAPEVMDAAIIAAAQKIEHYEIGSYGTARAYAEQMELKEVEAMLRQTLDEEYFADNSLTKIAVNKVNLSAETADETNGQPGRKNTKASGSNSRKEKGTAIKSSAAAAPKATSSTGSKAGNKNKQTPAKKAAAPSKSSNKKAAAKNSTVKKSVTKKKTASKSVKSPAKKVAKKKTVTPSKKSVAKKSAPKKSPAKKAAVKKKAVAPSKKSAPKKSPVKKAAAKKSASRSVKKSSTRTSKKSAARKPVPKKASKNKPARKSRR